MEEERGRKKEEGRMEQEEGCVHSYLSMESVKVTL